MLKFSNRDIRDQTKVSMAKTKLRPVVLDMISDQDIDDMKIPLLYHRELCIKKIERWTNKAYDQGALLTQLDLAMLLGVNEYTAGIYVREYFSLYGRKLPTRGNIQFLGAGQTHKKEILPFSLMAISSLLSVKEHIIL